MYLTRITIETQAARRYSADRLHEELLRNAADADRLQHVRIDVDGDGACVVFCLYVQARDKFQAGSVAEQLCRRTMASICRDEAGWSVQSTQVGP
jgi:hypothetical protein